MKKNLLLTTFGFVKRDLNERFWIGMAESASRIQSSEHSSKFSPLRSCACWLLTSTISSSSSSSSSPLLLLPREKSLLPSLSNISLLFCRFCTLSYVCIKDHVVIRSFLKKNWTFFPLCVCVWSILFAGWSWGVREGKDVVVCEGSEGGRRLLLLLPKVVEKMARSKTLPLGSSSSWPRLLHPSYYLRRPRRLLLLLVLFVGTTFVLWDRHSLVQHHQVSFCFVFLPPRPPFPPCWHDDHYAFFLLYTCVCPCCSWTPLPNKKLIPDLIVGRGCNSLSIFLAASSAHPYIMSRWIQLSEGIVKLSRRMTMNFSSYFLQYVLHIGLFFCG